MTDQCPRCHSFELVVDYELSEDPMEFDEFERCRVCGFVLDLSYFDDPDDLSLPHYSIGYRHTDILNVNDIENVFDVMPVDDLAESEVWLKRCEANGYEITKCVLVNEHGHVIWLRGSPCDWNWSNEE